MDKDMFFHFLVVEVNCNETNKNFTLNSLMETKHVG